MSRILIVDDNGEIREVITILLEGEGFETEEASSGEEALRKIKDGGFDLILLDVMMPGAERVSDVCGNQKNNECADFIFKRKKSGGG